MKQSFNVSMKQILILSLFICIKIFSQVGEAVAPLALDNYWVYEEYDDIFHTRLLRTTLIQVNDEIYIDSLKYFEISLINIPGIIYSTIFGLRDGFYVARRDSTFPMPNNEEIYYKKNTFYGDKWQTISWWTFDTIYYTIIDTAQGFVFGNNITSKLLSITDFGLLNKNQIWSEEFGLLADDRGEGFTYILKGCIIDGILYGDTIVTSVGNDEFIVYNFSLSQNFPNPFNSYTKIVYEVYSNSYVNLTVYNPLGESVSILINEEKAAGKYETDFNADELPSGLYFYRLTDGTNLITKKMLLLR